MLRRALTYIVAAIVISAPCLPAERKSWTRIRYVGGTIPVKTSPYDWNTTLTVSVNPNAIVLVIAPATAFTPLQTVRIQAADVTSLSTGAAAWRRVAEVSGAQLTAKPPALFGLLQDRGFLGIAYQTAAGKQGAVLLDSYFIWQILPVLKAITGKPIEDSP